MKRVQQLTHYDYDERIMRIWICGLGFLVPAVLSAGQIYGSVTSGGRAVPKADIDVRCGGAVTNGTTAADGSYRINVPQQGRCMLEMPGYPGRPSAEVFSYTNPTQHDFDLVRRPDGNFELRRR
jgi:hypothetical protein